MYVLSPMGDLDEVVVHRSNVGMEKLMDKKFVMMVIREMEMAVVLHAR
jgi:hypothetical protein